VDIRKAEAIFLAAAVELIHGATLLHDDVVDESSSRHNKPTANFAWGNKASILVGDFLFSQSFKLMVKSESMEALQSLSSASAIIAEGEVMQLARLRENKMISIEQYEEIAKAKTAALFGASAHVGAIIAGSDSKIKDAMKDFGILLGLIFQITDDMMDYYSAPNSSGKNLGDDLAQGNITAPVILAYNKATQQDKEAIENIFSTKKEPKNLNR
jgi:octaprenyl-diphosphate synthase